LPFFFVFSVVGDSTGSDGVTDAEADGDAEPDGEAEGEPGPPEDADADGEEEAEGVGVLDSVGSGTGLAVVLDSVGSVVLVGSGASAVLLGFVVGARLALSDFVTATSRLSSPA
jgi:hypothetical protein